MTPESRALEFFIWAQGKVKATGGAVQLTLNQKEKPMKVYISADIEGITGVTHWDETDLGKSEYTQFREQMTAEVAAACEGALEAGASEVWVKDAHDYARNLLAAKLPRQVRLIRGWSGHPFLMVQELDPSFQAVCLIGYHSRSGAGTSPLAHTMTTTLTSISINGRPASEFLIHTYAAASVNVPVVFVSGDKGLCDEIKGFNAAIGTLAVKEGIGNSTVSIHPQAAVEATHAGVAKAMKGDVSACRVELPQHFNVEIQYRRPYEAYKNAFFPGAALKDETTVAFESDSYYEVMRFFLFCA
jgi:D-amino peptidase